MERERDMGWGEGGSHILCVCTCSSMILLWLEQKYTLTQAFYDCVPYSSALHLHCTEKQNVVNIIHVVLHVHHIMSIAYVIVNWLVSKRLWTEHGESSDSFLCRLVRLDDEEREEVGRGSPCPSRAPRPLLFPPRLSSADKLPAKIISLFHV